MKLCSIYYNVFIHTLIYSIHVSSQSLIKITSLFAVISLLFSDNMLTGVRAEKPAAHTKSTNSKSQPSNHSINSP